MEWISVKDRLPPDDDFVLIWVLGSAEIGRHKYDESGGFWRTEEFDYNESRVTHWMPLPEKPKEDA